MAKKNCHANNGSELFGKSYFEVRAHRFARN